MLSRWDEKIEADQQLSQALAIATLKHGQTVMFVSGYGDQGSRFDVWPGSVRFVQVSTQQTTIGCLICETAHSAQSRIDSAPRQLTRFEMRALAQNDYPVER